MGKSSVYIGFSSRNMGYSKSVVKTDIELIKADLFNIFYTSPGEHKLRPLFGSTLRQKIFEQYNGASDRSDIIAEVKRVVTSDPRLTFINSVITDVPYGIVIAVSMIENSTKTPFAMQMQFNLDSDALYGISGS